MAFAFASRARSLSDERRPRTPAMQRTLPCTVSSAFVWVLIWCWMGRGSGDTLGRVEVEPGRDCCMSERFGGVCKEEKKCKYSFYYALFIPVKDFDDGRSTTWYPDAIVVR